MTGCTRAESPATGWQAELRLAYREKEGRTILADNRHQGPLRVQQPLYAEDGVCHTYVLHPPGGVVGGDSLSLELAVRDSAHALVTTPGATKFYRSAGAGASQRQLLTVEEDGVLEWLPQENILFPGAQATIATEVHLAAGARFIGWEILCLGLPTRKEKFTPGRLHGTLSVHRAGRPLFIDRLRVEGERDLDGPAGLRGCPVVGTLLAAGCDRARVEEVRAVIPAEVDGLVGATTMGELLVVRYLGHSTMAARAVFATVWARLRPSLIGLAALPPRIWAT